VILPMPGNNLVQSVLRAVDLLELLASHPGGVSLGELCARLRLKAPTVHNLLRTLASRALVERHGPPVRYRLGPRLTEMAQQVEHLAAERQCEALLRQLVTDGVAESAHLAKQAAGDLVVVLRMDSSRPHLSERPVARPLHPYASCAGLVFQAFCGRQQLAAFRRAHPFGVFGAAVWPSEEEIEAELERIRGDGFCIRHDGTTVRVGVPYLGHRGNLEGVLGAAQGCGAVADAGASGRPGLELAARLQGCARSLLASAGFAAES
jgi:IclR family transcriptional regulator, KDG regulon repressor